MRLFGISMTLKRFWILWQSIIALVSEDKEWMKLKSVSNRGKTWNYGSRQRGYRVFILVQKDIAINNNF